MKMRLSVALVVATAIMAVLVLAEGKRQSKKLSKRSNSKGNEMRELETELSRVKRNKRSAVELALSRVKRRDLEPEESLTRVKRQELESDEAPLSRVKRHRRNAEEPQRKRKEHDKETTNGINAKHNKKGKVDQAVESAHRALATSKGGTKHRTGRTHHGHSHTHKDAGESQLKNIVEKALERAKKSHSNHSHSKQEKSHAKGLKQKKAKQNPKKNKFAKELFKFNRLKRELTHGISKQMKHLKLRATGKNSHFKRGKRSKHAHNHK